MNVMHISSDETLSSKIRKIAEADSFTYIKISPDIPQDSFADIFSKEKYELIIIDQLPPCIPIEPLLETIKDNAASEPSCIVICPFEDFVKEEYYTKLGIIGYFNIKDFNDKRLSEYLQTIKLENETAKFLQSMNIAAIDDSQISLNDVKQIFDAVGVKNVDYYKNPSKFIAEFVSEKKKHELFIIDLVMPTYSGDMLISDIRKFDEDAVIILMTAYGNEQVISRCMSLGADDFLTKPLEQKLFMLRLYSCIKSHRVKKNLQNKNNMLEELAERDNLTGLYNRTYFSRFYKEIFNNSTEPFSLIMADIDSFKRVNDQFGHLEGDRVLKEFSGILRDSLGADNFVCRWGGEEFIALIKTDNSQQVMAYAEKMRKAVNQHDFKNVDLLTASFGIACLREDDTQANLLHRMDNSLYLAKLTGKNKIVCDQHIKIIENGVPIKIKWGSFFASGNAKVDEDHRNLIEMTNKVLELFMQKKDQDEFKKMAQKMADDLAEHFLREEEIIKAFHYDGYEEHKKNHHDILREISAVYKAFIENKCSILTLVDAIVQKVIVEQIIERDFLFYDIFHR